MKHSSVPLPSPSFKHILIWHAHAMHYEYRADAPSQLPLSHEGFHPANATERELGEDAVASITPSGEDNVG
jgi:hypothetical protein